MTIEKCPVHDIKCEEWKSTEMAVKEKVPIWVFKLSVTILVIILSGMNAYFYKLNTSTLVSLEQHVIMSNAMLKKISQKTREIIMNQKIVTEHLDIPYREIPPYYGDDTKE